MSTVGTLVRFPGIIPLLVPTSGVPPVIPPANQLLRGHLVSMTGGFATIMATVIAAGTPLYGIALSDADPDTGSVQVATGKGIATVSVMPIAAIAGLVAGSILFQAATPNFQMVNTAGTVPLGYCVNAKPDSLGNIEMAFFSA